MREAEYRGKEEEPATVAEEKRATGAWADDPSFLNSAGVSVQMKEWERSEHAGHLRHHREEYVHLLRDFMHQQQPPPTTTTAAGVVEHGDGGSARARKRR